jgi:ribosome-binding protein aMBF1 (putative translation factor)
MAKGHTYFWQRPGRWDEERKTFAALVRKVEATRIRDGMSKAALAAELGTTTGALRNWMTGRAIGRKEAVARLEEFIRHRTRQFRQRLRLRTRTAKVAKRVKSVCPF